jgi:uracil phosphoribosyltransferase
MRLLAEDALAEFPTEEVSIQTPCGPFLGIKSCIETVNICAVSIIRSGDALLEAVREVEPALKVGKILIQRDEKDPQKRPVHYYSKLPRGIDELHVLLCDPMIATGGSAVKALQVLCDEYGVDPARIVFASMISAPEGLRRLAKAFPTVRIVTANVDECLTDDKFIFPGLGDYGDRFFNT